MKRTLLVTVRAISLAAGLVTPALIYAQSAENVAVVINDSSTASQRIGEHYAQTRALPPANVLHIRTATEETIDRDTYSRTIEQPLGAAITRAGLEDRLLYLVLTTGVPLRVTGTTGLSGTQASVDSELTLLYRRLAGEPPALIGKVDNPYFLGNREIREARPFSHHEYDVYLVTRLDAYTADQALALIDRARTPVATGRLVFDRRGSAASFDRWLDEATTRVTETGRQSHIALEMAGRPSGDQRMVLGYASSGTPDPPSPSRGLGMTFAPGALATNFASADARTFRQPPDDWRPAMTADPTKWFAGSGGALIGDLVRDGVTGVSGQVAEAYVLGAVRPDILFPAYLSGFNLVESFYLATPTLSWQTIVIGDPLCAPFGRVPLTRDQLEEPIDTATGLPGLFARRRVDAVLAANRDLAEEAAHSIVLSQTLLERDDRAGARRALEKAVALTPRVAGIMVVLAQLEEEAGDLDAAEAHYRRILELQPTNVVALNNLAFSLAIRRNTPEEALPLARRAAALAPRAGSVLDTLGWVEHLAGNDDTAATVLAQAVRLEPGQAAIRLHAAIVYAATGNAGRADAELTEALRLDPGMEASNEVRLLRQLLTGVR